MFSKRKFWQNVKFGEIKFGKSIKILIIYVVAELQNVW